MFPHNPHHFKNIHCTLHPQECYSLICVESDCQNRGLICGQCQFTNHFNHTFRSLTTALNQIRNDLNSTNNLIDTMAKIDHEHIKIKQLCFKIANEKEQEMIGHCVDTFIRDLCQRVKKYQQTPKLILQSKSVNVKEINQCILKYKFYERENQEDKKLTNYQLFLRDVLFFLKDKINQLQQSIKKRMDLNGMLSVFTPFEQEQKVAYTFSEILKHSTIQLSADKLQAVQKSDYNSNYVLIEPSLQSKGRKLRSIKSIKMSITKLNSWVTVGVAYSRFASQSSFIFNTGDVGHGSFMMSYDGYSMHHSDPNLNSKNTSFSYALNEVVIVTINPKTKKIIFSKQNSQSTYELPYDLIDGEDLYFAVSLNSPDEAVSIIK